MAEDLKNKFFSAKRRLVQVALEKTGKATSVAEDAHYTEATAHVAEVEAMLGATMKQAKLFTDATRSMAFSSSEMGVQFNKFIGEGEGADAGAAAAAARFHEGMASLDTGIRPVLDEAMQTKVMEPIGELVTEIRDIRRKMTDREQHRLDYDAYYRNVRSLKEKPSPNPRKLTEKEHKLAHAKVELEQSTNQVLYMIQAFDAKRHSVAVPWLRAVVEVQTRFFADAAAAVARVGAIPEVAPRPIGEMPAYTAPDAAGIGGGASAGAGAVFTGASAPSEEPGADAASAAAASAAATAPPLPAAADSGKGAGGMGYCKAQFDYEPASADELALKEGDVVAVLAKQEDGWWQGTNKAGQTGVFPANYVAMM